MMENARGMVLRLILKRRLMNVDGDDETVCACNVLTVGAAPSSDLLPPVLRFQWTESAYVAAF